MQGSFSDTFPGYGQGGSEAVELRDRGGGGENNTGAGHNNRRAVVSSGGGYTFCETTVKGAGLTLLSSAGEAADGQDVGMGTRRARTV